MPKIAILYTTCSSLEEAQTLAEQAVKQRYAACVNIIPGALSIYEWEGKIEKAQECFLLFKTDPSRKEDLHIWITKNHPYTTPAILKGDLESSPDFQSYIRSGTMT